MQLDEVVVSAQKRMERLQDVPVPVTAISGESLVNSNNLRIQDYYTSVPGLNFKSLGRGDAQIAIRGVTTGGQTNPTVGITVDDVPFGSTSALGSLTFAPDIDPSDLTRVEVLRGPQGTLYGASSIGGLLKFVTVDPSTEGVSGRVQASVNSVHNGDTAGYGIRGAINLPLGETFALRATGFSRREPGYVDDPTHGRRALNQTDVDGGRLSALWRPSGTWSVRLSALLQDISADGASDVSQLPGAGDLDQVRSVLAGDYRHKVKSYTANLSGALGNVKLTSISGYSIDQYDTSLDQVIYGQFFAFPIFGVTGTKQFVHRETKKFTQEVRLAGALGPRMDWLVGGFYTHEDTVAHDVYMAVDPPTSIVGLLVDNPFPTTYAEYAAFGDLTVHFTDRFDIQLGGRQSQNRQRYEEGLTGPFNSLLGLPSPTFNSPVHTKDSSFTYLLTPRFEVSPDLMVYARFASGYRPGGPNPLCEVFIAPCEYGPDKTFNYELGIKGDALNRTVTFDASIYYIDWKDIQIQIFDLATSGQYYINAAGAKSQGLELSVQARPVSGLTLAAWVAWNDAVLTEDFPLATQPIGVFARSGDRLPASSRFSGNFSVDEEFPLMKDVTGFIGGSVSYVGDRAGGFKAGDTARQPNLPSYVKTDLRAGVTYESWTVNFFVNNVADKRGILSGDPLIDSTFYYIQPRTIGLSLAKVF